MRSKGILRKGVVLFAGVEHALVAHDHAEHPAREPKDSGHTSGGAGGPQHDHLRVVRRHVRLQDRIEKREETATEDDIDEDVGLVV